MPSLRWVQRESGWRAGRYDIELAAPGLWVCSRRPRREGSAPTIEETAGSLASLKHRMDRLETRRRHARQAGVYGALALALSVVVGLASASSLEAAPLVVVSCSALALVCALRAIDGVVRRSWEALSLNYQ